MLPLIPIIAIASSAVVLIRRKLQRDTRKEKLDSLIDFAKKHDIPLDINGSFNPDTILSDGFPILFHFFLNTELLVSLLEYGANPNICNAVGTPAIVYAVKQDLNDAVSTLLKFGANPNAMDSKGKSAFFHTKNESILRELINAGADMNAVDCTGKTALFYSFANGATRTLIKLGVDVTIRDAQGRTAVFYISGEHDLHLVNLMKERGLDLCIKDNDGISFADLFPKFYVQCELNHKFYHAVNNNNLSEVKSLLEQGANPNYCDETIDDWNMIDIAIYNSSPKMIELLVNYGADINNRESLISPLARAVYSKNFNCFKKLLELGADPSTAREAVEYTGSIQMKLIFRKYDKN